MPSQHRMALQRVPWAFWEERSAEIEVMSRLHQLCSMVRYTQQQYRLYCHHMNKVLHLLLEAPKHAPCIKELILSPS